MTPEDAARIMGETDPWLEAFEAARDNLRFLDALDMPQERLRVELWTPRGAEDDGIRTTVALRGPISDHDRRRILAAIGHPEPGGLIPWGRDRTYRSAVWRDHDDRVSLTIEMWETVR